MIKDIMTKNENVSLNEKQIQALKEYFPACFHNGGFDMERFKEYLGDSLSVDHEGYELKFLGKNYARLLASVDTTTVVVPDEEHNSKPENVNSQNVYISGDNLDALKHLLKSYYKQVKCIYIDPPYNTGSDGFAYNDTFNFTVDDLVTKLSISEEQATRILNLTKKGSASHSAWLMFMYPRLLLARDLLDTDGVIFISVDDNEQANLKLICDDVFSEENFVAQLVWEKKRKGSFLSNNIVNVKEYVLAYSRSIKNFDGLIGEINKKGETYPCIKTTNARGVRIIKANTPSRYKQENYKIEKGTRVSSGNMELIYLDEAVIKDGKLVNDIRIDSNWIYSQEALDEYAEDNELYITQDLYIRRIVTTDRKKKLRDLLLRIGRDGSSTDRFNYDVNLMNNGWGTNEAANDELHELLGAQYLFDYPKPSKLISKLLQSINKKDGIVLDFFAGSATTMQAVMQLNAEDKGNRKAILVQLPELLDIQYNKATNTDKDKLQNTITFLEKNEHPRTLDYLGYERVIRAAKKIREENPDTIADLGFRHYKLVEPSTVTLDKIEKFNPDENGLLSSDMLNEFGLPTVLATWLVRDGYGLTSTPQKIDFANYQAYYIGKHLYLITQDLTKEAIDAILVKYETDGTFNPEYIVLFGYSFTWTELETLKTNLKRLKEIKNLQINFDIRY